MSLRFRNELQLSLRMRSCHVALLGRGWDDRPHAEAEGTGSGTAALTAALQALRLTEIRVIPTVARLTVADELVYHALVEGGSWSEAREQARTHFSLALERSDLRVQVMPLGRSQRWMAAAVPDADLAAWRAALASVQVRLTHLHTALLEDLRRLAAQVREDDAVIALLREEGVSVVRLRQGVPVALAWERFDPLEPQALEQRLRAFVREAAARAGVGAQCVVYLLPESGAVCRYVWDGRDLPGLFPRPLEGIGTLHMSQPMGWRDTVQLSPAALADRAGPTA